MLEVSQSQYHAHGLTLTAKKVNEFTRTSLYLQMKRRDSTAVRRWVSDG